MTATLIDGRAIAARMQAETKAEAETLATKGWAPRLVSISVGDVFMGAVVPGLGLALLYLIFVATIAAIRPQIAPPL